VGWVSWVTWLNEGGERGSPRGFTTTTDAELGDVASFAAGGVSCSLVTLDTSGTLLLVSASSTTELSEGGSAVVTNFVFTEVIVVINSAVGCL